MEKQLNKSEIKKLNFEIENAYALKDFFNKKDDIILIEKDNYLKIKKEEKILFFYKEGRPVPTLKLLLNNNFLKKVVVDAGAVEFVTKGADIMRPGIVSIYHTAEKGDIVTVVDEAHNKPLVVGRMLYSCDEALHKKEGKIIENLHYVGDSIWEEQQ